MATSAPQTRRNTPPQLSDRQRRLRVLCQRLASFCPKACSRTRPPGHPCSRGYSPLQARSISALTGGSSSDDHIRDLPGRGACARRVAHVVGVVALQLHRGHGLGQADRVACAPMRPSLPCWLDTWDCTRVHLKIYCVVGIAIGYSWDHESWRGTNSHWNCELRKVRSGLIRHVFRVHVGLLHVGAPCAGYAPSCASSSAIFVWGPPLDTTHIRVACCMRVICS